MKMIKDFNELFQELNKDLKNKENNRFPLRIILIDSRNSRKKIIEELINNFIDVTIKLSDYCRSNDVFPDVHEAIIKAKEYAKKGKKVLLYPLEILRVDEKEFLNIIYELLDFQIDPSFDGRIYVLLYGVESLTYLIWKNYHDKHRHVPPFCLKTLEEDHITIWITPHNDVLKLVSQIGKEISAIRGLRQLLEILEESDLPDEILLYSPLLFNVLKKDLLEKLHLVRLETPKDVIEKLLNIRIPIDYIESEDEFWYKLMSELIRKKITDFEIFFQIRFNVYILNTEQLLSLFSRWNSFDRFEKWFLFSWAKKKFMNKSSYLYYALQYAKTYSELESSLWLAIFNIQEVTLQQIEERLFLVREINAEPPLVFFEKLSIIDDPLLKIKVITGISDREKEEIIKAVDDYLIIHHQLSKEVLEIIKITFPMLYWYLSGPDVDDGFVRKYIKEYIYAKIKDKFTPKLNQLAKKFSEKNMIWNFLSRSRILEEYKNYPLIWIDGLGVEWIEVIKNYFAKKLGSLKLKFIVKLCRANLPTTSEFNPAPNNAKIFRKLDQVFHSYDYRYPTSLIDEFKVLEEILENVKMLLEKYGRIIITADHGSTRFSGWTNGRIIISYEGKIERSGRYVIITNCDLLDLNTASSEYIIEHINENMCCFVSKTHKIFKGGKKELGEVHGGATLEESIIPVIVVELVHERKGIQYKIIPIQVSVRAFKPTIKLKVLPSAESACLVIQGKSVLGKKITENIWEFNLSKIQLRPGSYRATVKINEQEIDELEITIRGGLEEEELF